VLLLQIKSIMFVALGTILEKEFKHCLTDKPD